MKAATLQAFSAALSREAHRIASNPGLLWQQMHNRLQWEGPAASATLQQELNRRAAPAAGPWLRTRTPFRESRILARTLQGHRGEVNACAIGADCRTVVSAGDDYTVKIWDLTTGEAKMTLRGSGPMMACAITRDGRLVAGGDTAGAVHLWSAVTGQTALNLTPADAAIYGCDISPGDRAIVAACADGMVRVWDLHTGSLTAQLAGHDKAVYDVRFTPDGEQIVSAGEDGTLRIWNLSSLSQTGALKQTSYHSLRSCAVSRSGRFVAAVSDRAALTVWDMATGQVVREAWKNAGHHPFYWAAPRLAGVRGCAIHPDEKLVVSPAYDRTISVWEISSGQEAASLEGHTGWVTSCALTADGRALVTACSDATLRVWDLTDIRDPGAKERRRRYQPVKGCAFSPDGQRAISTCEDKSLTVWDVTRNAELSTFSGGHYNDFLACAIDPEGKYAVTTSTDNTLVVRTLDDGRQVASLHGHAVLEYPYLGVFACAFSPGGTLLVSAAGDKTLKLWDTRTWTTAKTLEGHSDRVFGCAIDPGGTMVVSAGFDSTVRIWSLSSGAEVVTLRGHKGPVYCCAISPDGRFIASAGGGGTITRDFKVRLWDGASGKLLGTLAGHSGAVRACTFTPDAAYCVTASEDGTLRIWDLQSYAVVATMFLNGKAYCAGVHPWRPIVGCGDHGGNFHLLDLLGIASGPIVVTAVDAGAGPLLHCPRCRTSFAFEKQWLGKAGICPAPDCGLRLRINPFVSRV